MSRCCMRPGRLTGNGYLNFLREFRMKNCGMTAVQTVIQGAKAWNRLSCKQKAKYRAMGCKSARRKRKRRSCRPKRRRRSGCRKKRRPRRRGCRPKKRRRRSGCRKKRRPKRRRSCRRRSRPRRRRGGCRKRKRCMKPGPVTANAYLNFLRSFRRKHCGLTPREAVKKGARKWCSLSPEAKRRYMRQACKMTKSRRKKRSGLCRSFRKKRRC